MTTYQKKHGEIVYKPSFIAKHYILSSRFVIDILACLPFDLIPYIISMDVSSRNFKAFQVLKLFRLLRLRRVINYLKFTSTLKLWLRIFLVCYNLFLFLHIVGCI